MRRILGVLLLLWPLLATAQLDPVLRDRWLDAVTHNDLTVLRASLGQIEQVDLRDAKGKTALMAAAAGGSVALAEALIQRGADPHALNTMQSSTLLYAAWSGDVEVLELLLSQGVDVDRQARNGWNALMMTAAKQHVVALERLCAAGASPNQVDVYLWTPLMRAAYEGYAAVVDALLACPGVDLTKLNDRGQSALHLAAIRGDAVIFATLLARSADPDAEDYAGNTPRGIAIELSQQNILRLLDADPPGELTRRISAGG